VDNAEQVCFGEMEATMKLSKIISFALAIAATGSAGAAGIGVRAGTNGLGADIGWGIAPTLSARLGYSWLDNYNVDVNTTDVNYSGKLKISSVSGLLDWSPLGPFRITAGIVGNDNKLDVTGVPAGGTFTINGITYAASDVGSLTGTVKPGKKTAPYLGIGYGNVAGAGVNFYFDIGVIFQGSPKSTLTATCGPAVPAGQCAQLQNDVAAEQQSLNDSMSKYKYFPVANIGITIGF
jgi:hypothetical protein